MPPVPKKADWPKESRPVKPNRISKPMPNSPQTRMRLIVVGVNPRYGRTKGAAINPTAANISMRKGRCLSMRGSFPTGCAEQSVRTQHEHQRHRNEQHHVRVARVEHGGDADDLASDEAAQNGSRKGPNAADDDHDESLHQDPFPDVGCDRDHRRV